MQQWPSPILHSSTSKFLILDGGDMHIQKWRQPNISFNMFQLSASLNRWKKPMSSYIDEKLIPFASLWVSLSLSWISLSFTDLEFILRVRLWMTSILTALPVVLWPTLLTWIPFPFDDRFASRHGLFSSSVCPSLLFQLSPFFLQVPNILRRKGERRYGGGLFSIRLRSGVLCDHRSE